MSTKWVEGKLVGNVSQMGVLVQIRIYFDRVQMNLLGETAKMPSQVVEMGIAMDGVSLTVARSDVALGERQCLS
jgi:riboflavin synthase alpha subunit